MNSGRAPWGEILAYFEHSVERQAGVGGDFGLDADLVDHLLAQQRFHRPQQIVGMDPVHG